MDGMIEVRKEIIGGGEVNALSAREFHVFLENGKQFSDWIKDRITKYGFMEGVDFIILHQLVKNPPGGRPTIEYTISLDMAKQLAMVEKNKKGRLARQYFIECERRLKEVINPSPIPIPIQDDPMWLAVDARELYIFMESKQDFSNWIKGRIDMYEL